MEVTRLIDEKPPTPLIVHGLACDLENEQLRYGDTFTITEDKAAENGDLVRGVMFVAVPPEYEESCESEYIHEVIYIDGISALRKRKARRNAA